MQKEPSFLPLSKKKMQKEPSYKIFVHPINSWILSMFWLAQVLSGNLTLFSLGWVGEGTGLSLCYSLK